MQALGGQRVALISLDEFYRDLTEEEHNDNGHSLWDSPNGLRLLDLDFFPISCVLSSIVSREFLIIKLYMLL